ncbi:MAG: hypothetical protein KAV87_40620 [Desulfobacteraceae bacterium]|nr:hypothetical protein [Desulfobacteraceae bacterium]
MRYRMTYLAGLLVVAGQIAGCATYQKQKELEKVAKDWCLTIRASQVIPVYPLTEDLEPGDLFLVQTPICKQAKEYTKRGFLPLDQHMTRLSELDYQSFYQNSFGIDTYKDTPHHWQFPETAGHRDSNDPNVHRDPTDWHKAPRAAFPSYIFSVQTGTSIQAALPIKGVPVGLSMIRADKASGSVTISDAYTYGVPFDELVEKVNAWALKNRKMLCELRREVQKGEPWLDRLGRLIFTPIVGKSERTIYLRVVNRVYLTGHLVVSLYNTTSRAIWGAIRKGEEFTVPRSNDVNDLLKNYNDVLRATDTGFGGSLRAIWATDRSVSISETFDRPLVIGYLGFDFPVMKGGLLGTPIATLNQISGVPQSTVQFTAELAWNSLYQVYRFLKDDSNAGRIVEAMDALESRIHVPVDVELYRIEIIEANDVVVVYQNLAADLENIDGFEKLNWFHKSLKNSIKTIERLVGGEEADLQIMGDDNTQRKATEDDLRAYRRRLKAQKKLLETFEQEVGQSEAVRNAITYFSVSLFQ